MPTADELDLGQHRLARVIRRARAGEDLALAQQVREAGESLAHMLGGLLKMTRVHAADNRAFDAPVESFVRALLRLVELLGTVQLATVEDQVYVNDVRIRTEAKGAGQELGAEFAKHNAGGAIFHAALDSVAVRALVSAFTLKPAAVSARRALQEALAARGVRGVELTPRYKFGLDSDPAEPVDPMKKLLEAVASAYVGLAEGRSPNAASLRRVASRLLELGLTSPAVWSAVSDPVPWATHVTQVALISLLIGKALGLRPESLHDLGVTALLHDAGYTALPPEGAGGGEGLVRHPSEGARILLRQRGHYDGKLRRLRAVLDHHRDFIEPRGRASSWGQILRLAEDFTTLVRVYAHQISPVDALGAMSRAAGKLYHPVLMQLMVNSLGRYPPGTLLELEDGRFGRSESPVRSPETFAAPWVRIYDLKTRALSSEVIDLAVKGGIRRVLPG